MAVHQCPKCDLRFSWKTEVDDHCWHDHPEFQHEYPAMVTAQPVADRAAGDDIAALAPPAPERKHLRNGFVQWLVPRHPEEHPQAHRPPAEADIEQRRT